MPKRIRITYVTGSSSIADDQRQQWLTTQCAGTPIQRYGFHTITAGSAGTVEIDSPLPNAVSLSWTITGRTTAGSIHMRFERSEIGDFSDAVLLFDQVVNYASGIASVVCVSWGATPVGNCQYGTRTKAGRAVQEFLTQPLIEAILAGVSASPLAPALAGFFGTVFLIEELCNSLPPPVPPIEQDVWKMSGATLFQLLSAAAWPYYCECVPGAPAPITPPLPVIVVPPGLAVPPAQVCDPLDLCQALLELLKRTATLEQVVGNLYQLLSTTQRYSVPFSYVKGRSIGNVAGTSSQQINRVVGLAIDVTQRPPGLRQFTGEPPYISDLGWISALTPDGMLDEIRLTRDHTTWFSKLLPTATVVGWGLRDGVTVTITELLAEP